MTGRDLCELAAETIASVASRVEACEDWGIQEKAPGVSDRGFCELVAAHLLVDRRKWLPRDASSGRKTIGVIIDLAEARKRLRPARLEAPPIVKLLELADAFEHLISTGAVNHRAELADRYGMTRARVTQILNLLKLHPAILAYLRALPPGTPARLVTERKLRSLSRLAPDEQLRVAPDVLPRWAATDRRVVGGDT